MKSMPYGPSGPMGRRVTLLVVLGLMTACLDREPLTPGARPAADEPPSLGADHPTLSSATQSGNVTFVSASSNQSNGTSISVSAPGGLQEGDLMLAQVVTQGSPQVTGAPAGWTLIRGDYNGTHSNSYVYWKRVTGSEPSSYSWNLSGSTRSAGGIAAYRSVIQAGNPIDAHGGQHNSGTNIVAPSVTTTMQGVYLVALYSAASDARETNLSFTPPAGMTEHYDVSSQMKGNQRNAVAMQASAPLPGVGATGSRTAVLSASRTGWGQLIALKPAPPVASIVVTPSSHTFTALGQTQQFTATAYDAGGNEVNAGGFTWSSSAPTIVGVDGTGLATANAAGTAEIRASAGGVTGVASATVTATTPPPAVSWIWSGGQRSNGVTVKTRLEAASSSVRLHISPDSLFGFHIETATTSTAGNHVATFVVNGLSPATRYHYRPVVAGAVDVSKQGAFETLPATGSAYSFTFALGSCQRSGSNKAVFDHIRATRPLFWLQAGDIHYSDIAVNDIELFRAAYNTVQAQSRQAALFRSTPIVHMWDDHDGGGGNDGDRTGAGWPAARSAYRENVPHHSLVEGAGGAIYHSFVVGRVRFIVSDLRSERSPKSATDNANKTMFGSTQKQHFKSELAAAKAANQFVAWVTTLPWIAARSSGQDHWGGYDTERQEIAAYIDSLGIGGQMFALSGDMHASAIDSGVNNVWGGFPIFHAAPIDQDASTKGGPYSQGPWTNGSAGEQFGLITISDNGGSSISVTFSARRNGSQISGASYQFTRTLGGTEPPPPPPPPPASVTVSPATHTFTAIGQTQLFTATAYDANGNPVAAQFTWSSSASSVASVNSNGLVTANGNGTAWIRAQTGSVRDSARVDVTVTAPSHFTNFGNYTTGVRPSDWSSPYSSTSYTVQELTGATGGKVLTYTTPSGDDQGMVRALRWNTVGTLQNVEIEAVARVTSESVRNDGIGLLARGSGSGSSATFYSVRLDSDANEFVIRKVVSGNWTTLARLPNPYSRGTWLHQRFRVEGNQLRAKIWPAGGLEPSAWSMQATDGGTVLAAGFVGVFMRRRQSTNEFDWVRVTPIP